MRVLLSTQHSALKKGNPNTSSAASRGPRPTITASQIGEYNYCSRAWWYKHVVKLPLPQGEGRRRLAEGTRAHARHGRTVSRSLRLRSVGVLLALLGLLVLAFALLALLARP